MEFIFIEGKSFEKIVFASNPLQEGEYEHCSFMNCDFSNADFSGFKFTNCRFVNCNLSLLKLNKTAFREVHFTGCKMLGLMFEHCNGLGLSFRFDDCMLSHSSFYQTKIKKTVFKNCQLHETDFSLSDLTAAIFDACDLLSAKFENTVIEKADFRTSYNYSINPEMNHIKKACFSIQGVIGLLDAYDIEIEY